MQLRDITPAVFRVGQITGADRLYFIWRQALNKVIIFIWGLSRDWLWQVASCLLSGRKHPSLHSSLFHIYSSFEILLL